MNRISTPLFRSGRTLGLCLALLCHLTGLTSGLAQTVVQFKTKLGSLELELFDKDKPVTVGNFLNYVTNGYYTNMFFHRWVSAFVIQGGGFAVAERGTTNEGFVFVKNLGNIVNEYSVGQKRSNLFGTIAMAKQGGDPNSASSQWFLNLGDNSANLDNQNGGFTVFGQVISGTNLLHRFNNTDPTNGVFLVNLGKQNPNLSVFSDLPVYSASPTFEDVAYVDISIIPKSTPPTITAQPQSKTVVAGQSVEFSVAATGTETLLYQWNLNGVPIPNATSATFKIAESSATQSGRYTVTVANGSGSVTSAEVVLEVRLTLAATIVGSGTVTKVPDLPNYAPGTSVTLTAIPSPGWIFARWEGAATGGETSVEVALKSHANATAVFESIPTPPFSIAWNAANSSFLELVIPGLDRGVYEFETSIDLTHWTTWLRLTNASGTVRITDPRGMPSASLFYRARLNGFAQ